VEDLTLQGAGKQIERYKRNARDDTPTDPLEGRRGEKDMPSTPADDDGAETKAVQRWRAQKPPAQRKVQRPFKGLLELLKDDPSLQEEVEAGIARLQWQLTRKPAVLDPDGEGEEVRN
jgi:hypothetical protein